MATDVAPLKPSPVTTTLVPTGPQLGENPVMEKTPELPGSAGMHRENSEVRSAGAPPPRLLNPVAVAVMNEPTSTGIGRLTSNVELQSASGGVTKVEPRNV